MERMRKGGISVPAGVLGCVGEGPGAAEDCRAVHQGGRRIEGAVQGADRHYRRDLYPARRPLGNLHTGNAAAKPVLLGTGSWRREPDRSLQREVRLASYGEWRD